MIIIAFILLIIFRYGLRFSHTIREKVSETTQAIINPRALFVDIIWGLIKGIIVGIFWKYLFINITLAVISFIVYQYKK